MSLYEYVKYFGYLWTHFFNAFEGEICSVFNKNHNETEHAFKNTEANYNV